MSLKNIFNSFFSSNKSKIILFANFSARVKNVSDKKDKDLELPTFLELQIVTERLKLMVKNKKITEAEEKLCGQRTYYFLYEHFFNAENGQI